MQKGIENPGFVVIDPDQVLHVGNGLMEEKIVANQHIAQLLWVNLQLRNSSTLGVVRAQNGYAVQNFPEEFAVAISVN